MGVLRSGQKEKAGFLYFKIKWLLWDLKSCLSPYNTHCPLVPICHRFLSIMQFIDTCNLLANYFLYFSTSYYLSNIISLHNERTLTRITKSNEAYSRLETASRINRDTGNAAFDGLHITEVHGCGQGFTLFFSGSAFLLMSLPALFLASIHG